MKITIVGLGLIGGSYAKDLRKLWATSQIMGVDSNAEHARQAVDLGLVDTVLDLDAACSIADLVIVAVPVNVVQRLLPGILDIIQEHTTVIDAGSTKVMICDVIRFHKKRGRFIAAHPIAGTENSGPSAAIEGLFKKKVSIICEAEKSSEDALAAAKNLFTSLGMRITFMEPREHDKHVAYVSHLSHVSSFLLGQTVLDIEGNEKNIFNLAGSGFASTVRLAKSSPEMWAPIFEQNSYYLKQALEEYIEHLQKFHRHLVRNETQEVKSIMQRANEIRRVLEGIELKDKESDTPISKEKITTEE
ncbi:MAG: prephenate dehydrogenase [Flammeovirgaceae bacterium]|nr:prephenate dehydrogenase [Flammeovirgaceae bacterium]